MRQGRLVAVVVALVAVGCGGSGGSSSSSITLPAPVGGVTAIPGFAPRTNVATATVDGRLFVFGGLGAGTERLQDGVLVAPDFRSATRLPDAPFDPPVYAPRAVGVAGRVVVVGEACRVAHNDEDSDGPRCDPDTPSAAVLDPGGGRNTWHVVAVPAPLRTVRNPFFEPLGATTDGHAIFSSGFSGDQRYWSFDVAGDEWHEIPGPGVRPQAACLSGDDLVVLSTKYRNGDQVVDENPAGPGGSGEHLGDGYVWPTIAALDLVHGTAWSHSPRAEDAVYFNSAPQVTCTSGGAAVASPIAPNSPTSGPLRIYSLTGKMWSPAPPPPSNGYFGGRVWTGTQLVFLPSSAPARQPGLGYDPATGRWTVLNGAPAFIPGSLRDGTAIVGYAEPIPHTSDRAGVYRYVPQP